MIREFLNMLFGHRKAESSPEVYDLKDRLKKSSAKASFAAKQYRVTLQEVGSKDVTFFIAKSTPGGRNL